MSSIKFGSCTKDKVRIGNFEDIIGIVDAHPLNSRFLLSVRRRCGQVNVAFSKFKDRELLLNSILEILELYRDKTG